MKKDTKNTTETGNEANTMLATVLMPCGSNHSCYHCNNYYSQCTWMQRMTDEQYEKHKNIVDATK
jgi:hypothetical protein